MICIQILHILLLQEQEDEGEGTTKPESSASTSKDPDDEDFEVNSSSGDDEATIQEQEQAEGDLNHQEELNDLNAENEMSIEELRQKYSGLPDSTLPSDEDSNMSAATDTSKSSEKDQEMEESTDEESDSDVDMEMSDVESQVGDVGLKSLLDDSQSEGEDTKTDKNNDLINDAAAIAESIQPKGNTLSSTSVSMNHLYYLYISQNIFSVITRYFILVKLFVYNKFQNLY